jgi:hypothetical protein
LAMDSEVTSWATAISTHADNGKKIVFRYAEHFAPTFEQKSQPVRIIIVWKYNSESGQPAAEEHQRMNQMEDALELALGENCFATLALVSTGENLREWTYYSKSEDEFMARLNFALAGAPLHPIEIHIAHDPNWDAYQLFRSSMKKETIN